MTYQPKHPIFITSKGRYEDKYARTMKLFNELGIEYYLCVENQEWAAYSRWVPQDHLMIYPSTGIGRARQFTLEMARQFGAVAFWAIDDDITAVKYRKTKVNPLDMISHYEYQMDHNPKMGIIAPQYSNVLWRVSGDEMINAQCPGLFMLCRVVDGIDFDPRLMVGEELDWAFKFFESGYDCYINNVYSIDTQVIGKKPGKVGGISYANDEMTYSMDILEKRWGNWVTRRGDQLIKNWAKARKTRE